MDLREFYIMVKLIPKISKVTTFCLLLPCCFFQVYVEQLQSSASETTEATLYGEGWLEYLNMTEISYFTTTVLIFSKADQDKPGFLD